MSVVNSVNEAKKLFTTEFICPYCLITTPYDMKRMSKGMTIYPIPFLETNELHNVIECQVCKNAFDPEILKYSVQCLFRLAGVAKYQLNQGISPGYLKLQLLSDGLKESLVDELMSLAQH